MNRIHPRSKARGVSQKRRVQARRDLKEHKTEAVMDLNEDAEENIIGRLIEDITKLYTTLWSRLEIISSPDHPVLLDLQEFTKELVCLREYIVCQSCRNILSQEFLVQSLPTNQSSSLHLICKLCGDKDPKKACKFHPASPDLGSDFLEYFQLILQSYKEFCALFIQVKDFQDLIHDTVKTDPTFDALLLIKLLTEGALGTITNRSTDVTAEAEQDPGDSQPEPYRHVTITSNFLEIINPHVIDEPMVKQNQMIHTNSSKWPTANEVMPYASGSMAIMSKTSSFQIPTLIPQASSVSESGDIGNHIQKRFTSNEKRRLKAHRTNGPVLDTSREIIPKPSKKGCRCGNASTIPGKSTCCGQRCVCYVERRICVGCKCKGCKNPNGRKSLLTARGTQAQRKEKSGVTKDDHGISLPSSPTSALDPAPAYPVQGPMSPVEIPCIKKTTPHISINKY